MSHMVETMAYAGQVPWHGLGIKVESDLTPDDMLIKAGLNWSVEKADQYIKVGDEYRMTGQKALVRDSDNSILTYVSDDWNPVQNKEAFDFFADFVNRGEMEMHTAGSLARGRKVWALAKIVSDTFDVVANDTIESYLLFTNPHEYGKCIDIRYTPIRVVCNNTLTLALNGKSDVMVRLNHSSKFNAELVNQTLAAAASRKNDYEEACKFLASKRFTNETVQQYLTELYPSKDDELSRTANKVLQVIETQPGNEFSRGTWWAPYNAVTFMTDHVLGRSTDTRLASSWYGVNRNKKLEALNKAVEFANAA